MIVVVADTSPLNYLVQIHCQDLLPALYERVLVPPAVIRGTRSSRVSRNEELRMPKCREVVDDLQERELTLRRQRGLRLIHLTIGSGRPLGRGSFRPSRMAL